MDQERRCCSVKGKLEDNPLILQFIRNTGLEATRLRKEPLTLISQSILSLRTGSVLASEILRPHFCRVLGA